MSKVENISNKSGLRCVGQHADADHGKNVSDEDIKGIVQWVLSIK